MFLLLNTLEMIAIFKIILIGASHDLLICDYLGRNSSNIVKQKQRNSSQPPPPVFFIINSLGRSCISSLKDLPHPSETSAFHVFISAPIRDVVLAFSLHNSYFMSLFLFHIGYFVHSPPFVAGMYVKIFLLLDGFSISLYTICILVTNQ